MTAAIVERNPSQRQIVRKYKKQRKRRKKYIEIETT